MSRRILLASLLLMACGIGLGIWLMGADLAVSARSAGDVPHQSTPAATPLAAHETASAPDTPAAADGRAAVSLAAGSRSEVRVVDREGEPIEGAEVQRLLQDERGRTRLAPGAGNAPVFTDEHGVCTVPLLDPEDLIHVRAEGFEHRRQAPRRIPPTTLALFPVVQISGRVVAMDTVLPVRGAKVWVPGRCPVCPERSAHTDALGQYELSGVRRFGGFELFASASGFLRQRTHIQVQDASATAINLTLQRGAEVWLEFFNIDSGAAVGGVRVAGEATLRSDATGHLDSSALVRADAGERSLQARHFGYAHTLFVLGGEHLDPGVPLRVPMAPMRVIEGIVSDPSGASIEGARISITVVSTREARRQWREERQAVLDRGPDSVRFWNGEANYTTTSGRGRYRLNRVDPWARELEVRITCEGYHDFKGRRKLDGGTEPTWAEWTLVPAEQRVRATLRGVFSVNGDPQRGRLNWMGEHRSGTTSTDSDGTYEIEEIEVGRVRITSSPDRRNCPPDADGSWEVDILPGETTHADFDLVVPMATISGTLRYPDGDPIAQAIVRARSDSSCLEAYAQVDTSGVWSLEVPAHEGLWDLHAPDSIYFVNLVRHGIRPGTSGIELVVARPLRLRVMNKSTGLPVRNFDLRWQLLTAGAEVHQWRPVFSLRQGHLALDGWFELQVPEGPLELAVSTRTNDPYAQPAFARVLNTRGGQSLELTVSVGERIDLQLLAGAEPWPDDVELYLLAEHERGALVWDADRQEVRDGDLTTGHPALTSRRVRFSGGEASLTGLPPGEYSFVSFPDTVSVHPATVGTTTRAEAITLRWERR